MLNYKRNNAVRVVLLQLKNIKQYSYLHKSERVHVRKERNGKETKQIFFSDIWFLFLILDTKISRWPIKFSKALHKENLSCDGRIDTSTNSNASKRFPAHFSILYYAHNYSWFRRKGLPLIAGGHWTSKFLFLSHNIYLPRAFWSTLKLRL